MTFEVCSKLSESTKQTSAIVQLVIEGTPIRLVREWAKLHEEELREAFQLASNFQRPAKIEPLP